MGEMLDMYDKEVERLNSESERKEPKTIKFPIVEDEREPGEEG